MRRIYKNFCSSGYIVNSRNKGFYRTGFMTESVHSTCDVCGDLVKITMFDDYGEKNPTNLCQFHLDKFYDGELEIKVKYEKSL